MDINVQCTQKNYVFILKVIDLEDILQNSQDTMIIKTSEQEIFTHQLSQNYNDQVFKKQEL